MIIFTGGKLRPSTLVSKVLASADMVIAADSGAETALSFKASPSVVIGDFDSLNLAVKDKLAARGVKFVAYNSDKELTDTELAVQYALKHHASHITILGGLEGDRIDHILANVFSLIKCKVPIRFVNGPTTTWTLRGPATTRITGNIGDIISLIPLTSRASGMVTSGLRYPLREETLYMNRARGVSNVMVQTMASVTLGRGTLLLVQYADLE